MNYCWHCGRNCNCTATTFDTVTISTAPWPTWGFCQTPISYGPPAIVSKPNPRERWFDVFRFWLEPQPPALAEVERRAPRLLLLMVSAAVRRRWKRRRFVHMLRCA